jgi:UTP--glucose-1-phosphate uridylyltransferase
MVTRVRKAVIPAAGLGTRFLPASKAVPKEMLPIVDVPTIQLVVEEAVKAGIEDIIIVNGRHKSAIEEHFDHAYELEHTLRQRGKNELAERVAAVANLANLISVRQKQPLGLGHAVLAARHVVGDEPFAVLLADDLFAGHGRPGIGQLVDAYQATGTGSIAVMEVPEGQEHLYGIIAGDPDPSGHIRVREMVEKPAAGTAPSRLAIIGRYVLPPQVWPLLESTERGHGGEIQLTDALKALADQHGLLGVKLEGERHDAGDKLGFLRANLAFALERPDLADSVRAMMRELLDRDGG